MKPEVASAKAVAGSLETDDASSTDSAKLWRGPERRIISARRRYTLQTLWTCASQPRRMHGRRTHDRRYPILDRFDSGMLSLAVALMLLSVFDAIFTLTLLARGGTELNPVMNALLQQSVWAFTGVKMLLTGIPAIVLVAAGNLTLFKLVRARSILAALVGLYMGLMVYHICLLSLSA